MITSAVVGYCIFIVLFSICTRRYRTGDEYLMDDRRASPLLVAAALFTLVGGGELVTLTALAYTYGFAAIALFLGYGAGFVFLAYLSPKIRAGLGEFLHMSLPDYVHARFGRLAGYTVFGISFVAFYALLLIQFTAGGQILSPITGLGYRGSVLLTASIAMVYLSIGGFRTVLTTDLIQGIAMLVLLPVLVLLAARGIPSGVRPMHVQTLPWMVWVSLTVTGFFVSTASADVWQRIYVARSTTAARVGLVAGSLMLMAFGFGLVGLGILARNSEVTDSPDSAFIDVLAMRLPSWGLAAAVVLVLSTIMSTADTEMFLLSGMAERELARIRSRRDEKELLEKLSISAARGLMAIITFSAVGLSLVFTELVPIYTWLLSALLVIAPTVIATMFVDIGKRATAVSLLLNLVLFVSLAASGVLTAEIAYLIVLPGAMIYFTAYIYQYLRRKLPTAIGGSA